LSLVSPVASPLAPFCVGFAFRKGDVPAGQQVIGDVAHVQLTPKNLWPDGSLKFAVLAGRAQLAANTPLTLALSTGVADAGGALKTSDLKATGITASVSAGTYGTVSWAAGDWDTPFQSWVSGPQMSSWIYRKAIGSDAHLVAWLEVRLFAGGEVEVLPWIENGFLLVPGPSSKSATYAFSLGGTQRFSQAIDLPNHCRTPLVSGGALSHWLASDPQVTPKHDTAYLQSTNLVPSYRAKVNPSAAVVATLVSSYAPLQQGNYSPGMGGAGYHPSIGLLPEWDVLYLTSTSQKAYAGVIVNGYSAGRYGIHFRDEVTNRPLRFSSYPNLVVGGGSSITSSGASSRNSYTPDATGTAPATWASSHHPSVGFLAYLVTGRFYFMEEVQFAATLNFLKNDDMARATSQGIFLSTAGANTTRGAAWAIRTLAQAACTTPDADTPLRAEFLASLQANVDWNHARYVAQANNPFGWVAPYSDYTPSESYTTQAGSTSTNIVLSAYSYLTDGYYTGWYLSIGSQKRKITSFVGTTRVATVDMPFTVATSNVAYQTGSDDIYFEATWMQDFYTAAFGYAKALEPPLPATSQTRLTEFFAWKARSIIGRLGGTARTEYLFSDAAQYTIAVAPSDNPDFVNGTGPWFSDWGALYAATLNTPNPGVAADLRGAYFPEATAYWGNLQPAIAYAVQHGVQGAEAAYRRMTSAANWYQLPANFDADPVWSVRPSTEG
jgi:hypothetical protein